MSILAAKLPEVNIVELDSHTLPSIKPASRDDDRLAWLEAQVSQLNQWRESVTSPSTPLLLDGAASPAFSPNSPRSSSSVTSEDLPQLVSSQTLEQLAAPTSNLPKKTVSKKDEPLPVRILNIIETYGHNEPSAEGTTWLGRGKFESIVRNSVEANIPIEMVLPAFPWKSVNRVEKVTGALPDLGEELALARLQSLCEDIQAVYEPGAYVTVTSDGLVYCDLVGIPAEEVFEYGKALRNLAVEKGFDRLKFIRIMNLLGLTDSPHMTKEEYLASVESSRQALVEKHLPAGFDVRSDILNDADINLTYCGYIKFLTKDLKHSPITAGVKSNQEYRRVVKRVAHDMITRGKVCYPNYSLLKSIADHNRPLLPSLPLCSPITSVCPSTVRRVSISFLFLSFLSPTTSP